MYLVDNAQVAVRQKEPLCADCAYTSAQNKVRAAMRLRIGVEPDDRVAVCLSGGKLLHSQYTKLASVVFLWTSHAAAAVAVKCSDTCRKFVKGTVATASGHQKL